MTDRPNNIFASVSYFSHKTIICLNAMYKIMDLYKTDRKLTDKKVGIEIEKGLYFSSANSVELFV